MTKLQTDHVCNSRVCGAMYRCPRCKRGASMNNILACFRADLCSPKDWAHCIRDPQGGWVRIT